MKKIISFGAVLAGLPLFAFAADLFTILGVINTALRVAIPILITLAVVYFIWGVIQYTISPDEEAKKKARSKIIASLVGLFLIVAFWGVVRLITNTFGVGPEQLNSSAIPCIPSPFVTNCPQGN